MEDRINDPDANPVIIEPGLQTLNGEAALVYARSRAYVDGDFTRSTHQRELIEALIQKVLSLPVTELPGVIEKAAQCVSTDMSVTDIIALATQFQDLGSLEMYLSMTPSAIVPYLIDGVSFVASGPTALAQMMELVEAGEDPTAIDASSTFTESMIPSGLGGAITYSNDTYDYNDYSNSYSYDSYNDYSSGGYNNGGYDNSGGSGYDDGSGSSGGGVSGGGSGEGSGGAGGGSGDSGGGEAGASGGGDSGGQSGGEASGVSAEAT